MTNQTETLNVFIERLVEEKKFENVDADVLAQIKLDLAERLDDRINATILENMPKEKLEEFNDILDRSNSNEIHSFCQKNITNLDEVIADSLMRFRDIYLNS